eukprot:m.256942 g.256942  ORF g.256942 m.256942 type:complete len:658 (-) comp34847_c0_seq1:163-2136(-)
MTVGVYTLALASALAVVAVGKPAIATQLQNVMVNTTSGPIVGVTINGTKTFQGIPFAQPPVGALRFHPPQPAKPWVTPLETIDFKGACPQMGAPPAAGRYGPAWNTLNLTGALEDCLYANVYVPAAATEPLPVMVYLHAGEFRFGTANDRESSGLFGNDSMILVTANARLGYFGFAALDELRANDPHGSTGNYGIQDQRLVMQWVKDTIARFGGDPTRITIFGESSGGASVAMHLVSPYSKGLFTRAILESPGITQSKTWKDSSENTMFAASALASAGGEGCTWPQQNQTWITFPGLLSERGIWLGISESVDGARTACARSPRCMLIISDSNGTTSLYGSGEAGNLINACIEVFNYTQSTGEASPKQVEMRVADPLTSVTCLMNAHVSDLTALSLFGPHGDTFNTDAMAPTVDGIELTAPLSQLVRSVDIEVDVLGGANLDEGTEFMSLSPHIDCNASFTDFQRFSNLQFGTDLGAKVVNLYPTIETPVPLCVPRHHPSASSSTMPQNISDFYWASAMRSVGDEAIVCRIRDLLLKAQKADKKAWWYFFAATPIFSENMGDIPTMGAFHGSEIPFVFGDAFELSSDGERQLSRAMGCYWTNFAATGDPNQGDCANTLLLPAWPSVGSTGDVVVFKNTTIETRSAFKQDICDVFAQFP